VGVTALVIGFVAHAQPQSVSGSSQGGNPVPVKAVGPAQLPTGKHGEKGLGWCGTAGQPACPAATPDWIYLDSSTPESAAKAMAASSMLIAITQHLGASTVLLDLPVRVHPFGAAGGSDYFTDDHWVASVRGASGKENGIADFVYDASQNRIRFSGFAILRASDPDYGRVFPYSASSYAVAALATQRHLSLKSGTSPELVFFASAADYAGQPNIQWQNGGTGPVDPMWHVVGADGNGYFVGTDGKAYGLSQIPVAASR
jgi:hypothetical protein